MLLYIAPTNALQCMRDTDNPAKCRELRDDYLECLHHRKEVRFDAYILTFTALAGHELSSSVILPGEVC